MTLVEKNTAKLTTTTGRCFGEARGSRPDPCGEETPSEAPPLRQSVPCSPCFSHLAGLN